MAATLHIKDIPVWQKAGELCVLIKHYFLGEHVARYPGLINQAKCSTGSIFK